MCIVIPEIKNLYNRLYKLDLEDLKLLQEMLTDIIFQKEMHETVKNSKFKKSDLTKS